MPAPKKVTHMGRVTEAQQPTQAQQALAVVAQAAALAPLPKQGHLQVEQALAVLAEVVNAPDGEEGG